MTRSLRRNHCHIYILRRYDLSEVDSKTVGKHQHISCLKVRLNISLIHSSLFLIVNQNHNDICLLCCLCCCINFESLLFCSLPGLTALVKTNDDIASGLFQIQRMGMSLASVSNNRNRLPL